MDWTQVGVTVGAVVLAEAIVALKRSAKQDERMVGVKTTLGDHGKRLDDHDGKFEELNTRFVPRAELQASLQTITKSQGRMERWLEHVLFGKHPPPPTED